MNEKWKGNKNVKNSPVLFEDEEMGTSTDEVKSKSCATPHTKRFNDHSTPIRNKVAIDSPELNYNESPIIEPLTQHPPSEVGWDYRQFLKDDEDSKLQIPMNTYTPKRSTNHLLSKKRNSNSPLLYKPVKKKLIQDQQRESIEDFLNALKQIESTSKQKKDSDEFIKKTDSNPESQLVIDMEVVSEDSDMKLQVSANTNESPKQTVFETGQAKNHNALLDDSIEDMMVLCSQEIEAKEFGTKQNHNVLSLYTIQKNSSETSHNGSFEKVFKNPAKENIQPSHNNEKIINLSDISSRNSSKSSKSESFPDDSFDDFFVAIDDKKLCQNNEIILDSNTKTAKIHNKPRTIKVDETINKCSEYQKKFFQSKGLNHVESKSISTNKNYTETSKNEKVFKQTKVVNENASYGYLNKDYMKISSVLTAEITKDNSANGTRLFKAKSFSDSNFLKQNHQLHNLDRSYSNLNINSICYQKQQTLQQNSEGYGSTTSSESKGWRRTNSNLSIGYSQTNINILTNSETSQSTSRSAEEIERKRLEAIERRNRRMNNNAAQRRPAQQPVKR
ncbi:uncharacterized protein LOC131663535 [Phymastichus coffea]|uniref:uncharacterized protein LOC131663535 n=1 Tax=Phymastichus coffea TaxID=108790 RepID=UPI00273AC04D|nr:uncharacterized protein LOC131663535 [Phymastichus coffea]